MSKPRAARLGERLSIRLALVVFGVALQVGSAAAVPPAPAASATPPSEVAQRAEAKEAADAADKDAARSKLTVYFGRGSVALSKQALSTIAANVDRLTSDPTASVTLVGYTDEVGSSSYGVALAQRRALAVADALVGMGVDPRQIRATVYGEDGAAPPPCPTGDCPIHYRRVEFRYLKPEKVDLRLHAQRKSGR